MKLLTLIMSFTSLLFLSACGDEEDLERYVGRWSLEGGSTILQISAVEESSLQVDMIYITALNQKGQTTQFAKVEDGIMKIGEGAFTQAYRFDEEKNRLISGSGSYRPVPEGWVWRDGYDGLES